MISASEALERLRDGNRRFLSDQRNTTGATSQRRNELIDGQEPFAVVLGCSDSRVSPELIFNQGLGDLFVVRVAGNVAAPQQAGSIEFAVERLGVRLVVVLGHTRCGAIDATLTECEQPSKTISPNLKSIVDLIYPSLTDLLATEPRPNRDDLFEQAVRTNIHASVRRLRAASPDLERLIQEDELVVVGAEYSLKTGVVEFFANGQEPVNHAL